MDSADLGRTDTRLVSTIHGTGGLTLRIGLTGGLGSGKSTVAGLFEQLGIPVISADRIAREVVATDTPGLREIEDYFGPSVIADDGSLDRAAMRRKVFSEEKERLKLEAIIHPRLRAHIADLCERIEAPYTVIEIPLLTETGQQDMIQRVLVVEAPMETRIQRVMRRDKLSLAEIHAILAAQADDAQRSAIADDTLVNDRDLSALKTQVEALHQRYLTLAGAKIR